MKPAPFTVPWSRRLDLATPGLTVLGIDPGQSREKLLDRLSRAERFDRRHQLWVPTSISSLLSGSFKLDKAAKKLGFRTWGLTLSPDLESGVLTCPESTYCAETCLGHSTGKLVGERAQRVRIKKTLYWWLFPDDFVGHLVAEMHILAGTAWRERMKPALRLNVASDIAWERVPELQEFHGMTFYDYTKMSWKARHPLPPSWHLIYSLSEKKGSLDRALDWLDRGGNVAVVVGPEFAPGAKEKLQQVQRSMAAILRMGGKASSPAFRRLMGERRKLMPAGRAQSAAKQVSAALLARGRLWGHPVVDGDVTDARFMDERGSWVLLHAKGPSIYDSSGFVVRIRPDGSPVQNETQRRTEELPIREIEVGKRGFRGLLSPVARMMLDGDLDENTAAVGQRSVAFPMPLEMCIRLPAPWGVDPDGQRMPGGVI